ncbi:thaumatin-like protein 1 [Macadamia integrifolia]|uniref:thaumatin-like protein 1 n=1 Tax=Macadamia integrifolia TaxID=60698 RepID=UPI001C4F3071|nr:thaumatin-like protein 1 [Macadamia integrifolia]
MDIEGRLLFLLALFISGALSATFTFTNKCSYTVWPATLAGGGTSQLSLTGFELTAGASSSLEVPVGWSGRFWARTFCSTTGNFNCSTGDCHTGQVACNGAGGAVPATLVEFTLGAHNGDLDFYDVSLVDGFNLPVSVTPQEGSGSGCNSTSCPANINSICPQELSVMDPNGTVIGCKSACIAFGDPKYCCTGDYGGPATCPPTNYSMNFKKLCPQAYSYAYDDRTSTFTCMGANYRITFCP